MITINTLGHKDYFGTLAATDNCPSLRTTKMGDYTLQCWRDIPKHYPQISLDALILMPDHLHGLVKFIQDDNNILPQNQFGVQSRNLASAIRAFKATVKRFANKNHIEFNWQNGYHDRIIYTEEQLNHCRNYIHKNVTAPDRSGSPRSGYSE